MTELSFLIELLLNHDLPKATKDLLASRIKEVEGNLVAKQPQPLPAYIPPAHLQNQAPSTMAAMAKHADPSIVVPTPIVPVEPVAHIAQTPATAAALNARADLINAAIAGKGPMKNRVFK